MSIYKPSKKILEAYANVLVNFALNSGKGVVAGEVVFLAIPDVAKDLGLELQNALLRAAAHPVMRLMPTGFNKDFYSLANDEQLNFFPRKLLKEKAELIDHQIAIIADPDPYELAEINPQKIMQARNIKKPYRDWLIKKENKGEFTWTMALWGVEAKAKEVGLSLEEYWNQIIKACFLDKEDPISEWKKIMNLQEEIKAKLNKMKIELVKVEGEDVNLGVKIGADRIWNGGSGRNIPSFEIFTSPDWRGVDGWIKFNEPLYRYGNVIENVYLKIKNGIVVEAKAKKGNKFLQEMLKTKNANKIGEFSLTDKRMSRISHPMAETLFDENIGGKFGNSHLALGMAYKDCYRGDPDKVTDQEWEEMGFNDSAEHSDIITTTDRTVTAYMKNGDKKVIYKGGRFII